jgi:hypothetical protein
MLTSTYDAPRFAAAMKDCLGLVNEKESIQRIYLDCVLSKLQRLSRSIILPETFT